MLNLLLALAVLAATSAIATPNAFNIQLVFDNSVSAERQGVFNTARAKWESIIVSDTGGKFTFKADGAPICGQGPLQQDLVVDDILIFVKIINIDGAGGLQASAGPCAFQGQKVRLASIQFDTADIANLESSGTFGAAVLHQMGHCLGLGTPEFWDKRGLVGKNLIRGTTSFNYFGGNGVQGHREIGGGPGNAVIEGDGGAGVARQHWDKETYGDELMTSTLTGSSPLSRLTAKSLQDIGYNVNANRADAFSINGATSSPTTPTAPVVTKAPTQPVTKSPTQPTTRAPTQPTNAPVTKSPTVNAPPPTNAPVNQPPPVNNGGERSGFQIQLAFLTAITPDQRAAFESAANRWMSIIQNDIGSTVTIQQGQVVCGLPPQASPLFVDDILIFVQIQNIDGVGNTVVNAGPCALDQQSRNRIGIITIDSSDINSMSQSKLVATALHEMAHVFGIGNVWNQRGLAGRLLIPGTTSVRYFGPQGNDGHKKIGGQGNNAIVEGDFGTEIARNHWDKETYGDELMTGFLTGSSPLSVMTIQSLFDIGFNIDASKADAFTAPTPAAGRRLRELQDDNPIWETSWKGEMTWDLFPFPKNFSLAQDQWELSYQGAILELEEEAQAVNGGAIAGGLIGAFALVAAAAFVVIRRRKQELTSGMTSSNPMFEKTSKSSNQMASYPGDQQFGQYQNNAPSAYYQNNQAQPSGYYPNQQQQGGYYPNAQQQQNGYQY